MERKRKLDLDDSLGSGGANQGDMDANAAVMNAAMDAVKKRAVEAMGSSGMGASKAGGGLMLNDSLPTIHPYNGKSFTARFFEILKGRKTLPVWAQREEFVEKLHKNQIVLLVGETGSGKTTQVREFVAVVVVFLFVSRFVGLGRSVSYVGGLLACNRARVERERERERETICSIRLLIQVYIGLKSLAIVDFVLDWGLAWTAVSR